jgi:adenylate cyclase
MNTARGFARPQPSGSADGAARTEAARRLSEWLINEGRFLPDNDALFTEFCERVAGAGMPLDRATLHLRALHPEYRGVARIWRPGRPLEVRFMDHGIEKTATYIESPVRAVAEAGERLDWRLDGNAPLPFPLLDELREEGYTHYVIAPFVYAEGLVNAISWATSRPGGFAEDELHFLDEMLPALSVIVEQKAMRRFVSHMLTTYIGAEAGRLILDGQVRRGDVRTITAALMLVDMRDFSLLSDTMTPRAVIRMLNEYFDCVIPPVHRQGGEVVEIMSIRCPAAARWRRAAMRLPRRGKASRHWPSTTGADGPTRRCSGPGSRCITVRSPTAISAPATGSISP